MVKKNITYPLSKNNCAPCREKNNNNNNNIPTCYSMDSLLKIAKAWNKENKSKIIKITPTVSKKYLWNEIQKRLHSKCNKNETCWKKQDFIKKLNDIEIQMNTFKPDYPKEWIKDNNTWLNTYDILNVMKQYEKANKDFVFLGPIPSDCPTKIHCELTNLDLLKLKKKNITKIGIIYNLDVSTGGGTHWVAVYIDNVNNEINYYDSYGSKTIPLINKFIQKLVDKYQKNNIQPIVIYNDTRHQYGGSECGMYSMNFILERLHGKTMYEISKMKIPDARMVHLRNLLYNMDSNKN
jgi:hypothetical protein